MKHDLINMRGEYIRVATDLEVAATERSVAKTILVWVAGDLLQCQVREREG